MTYHDRMFQFAVFVGLATLATSKGIDAARHHQLLDVLLGAGFTALDVFLAIGAALNLRDETDQRIKDAYEAGRSSVFHEQIAMARRAKGERR